MTITHARVVASAVASLGGLDANYACLVCIYGDEIGKRWVLSEPLVIGRSSSSGITLDHEGVSRSHAKIQRRALAFVLTDLGSTNGTFVGDRTVLEHRLEDGDRVRIGRSIFKFLTGGNVEASYQEEMHRLISVDGLTQTYNRRAFDGAMQAAVARASDSRSALSLIQLDIDHFKRINDTHGHVVGDAVLRQMASVIARLVEAQWAFARTGGEEFALLLPGVARNDAVVVAERCRRTVADARFGVDPLFACTVSAGVAQLAGAESAAGLYERADDALYAAKTAGRNRVVG